MNRNYLNIAGVSLGVLFFAVAHPAAQTTEGRPGEFQLAPIPFSPAPVQIIETLHDAIIGKNSFLTYLKTDIKLDLGFKLQKFSAENDNDLRLLGALARRLPPDFISDLQKALQHHEKQDQEFEKLAHDLETAYGQAQSDLAPVIQRQLLDALQALGNGQMDLEQLKSFSLYLEKLEFYGTPVRELTNKTKIFVKSIITRNQIGSVERALAASYSKKIFVQDKNDPTAAVNLSPIPTAKPDGIHQGTQRQLSILGARNPAEMMFAADLPAAPYKKEIPLYAPGQIIDPVQVSHVILNALTKHTPTVSFMPIQDEDYAGVGIESPKDGITKFVFSIPYELPKPGEKLRVVFEPPTINTKERYIFLRHILGFFGITVDATADSRIYFISAYHQNPKDAARATLN